MRCINKRLSHGLTIPTSRLSGESDCNHLRLPGPLRFSLFFPSGLRQTPTCAALWRDRRLRCAKPLQWWPAVWSEGAAHAIAPSGWSPRWGAWRGRVRSRLSTWLSAPRPLNSTLEVSALCDVSNVDAAHGAVVRREVPGTSTHRVPHSREVRMRMIPRHTPI